MTQNPYAPPSAQVADPVEPLLPRPRRVTVAMVLFCIATAVGIILTIVQHRDRFVGETVLAIGLTVGLTAGLCIAIDARRNWARWVYSAVILLPLLGNFRAIAGWLRQPFTLTQIIILVTDTMALLSIILLFTAASGRWFRQSPSRG